MCYSDHGNYTKVGSDASWRRFTPQTRFEKICHSKNIIILSLNNMYSITTGLFISYITVMF